MRYTCSIMNHIERALAAGVRHVESLMAHESNDFDPSAEDVEEHHICASHEGGAVRRLLTRAGELVCGSQACLKEGRAVEPSAATDST